MLQNYDPETTQVQSLEDEYHRLQTLRSYDILDLSSNPTLERLTAMTSRMLHCPIAYVGTMDIGRYNILAGKGLGTLKNVHRKVCVMFGVCNTEVINDRLRYYLHILTHFLYHYHLCRERSANMSSNRHKMLLCLKMRTKTRS